MLDSLRNRGFEVVADNHRRYPKTTIELPVRGDDRSAGYDIKTPVKITLQPNERTVVWTDIKAYMLNDEVVRLSIDKEDWTGCEMKDSNMKKKREDEFGRCEDFD